MNSKQRKKDRINKLKTIIIVTNILKEQLAEWKEDESVTKADIIAELEKIANGIKDIEKELKHKG